MKTMFVFLYLKYEFDNTLMYIRQQIKAVVNWSKLIYLNFSKQITFNIIVGLRINDMSISLLGN